ncbi:uncharacterized protein RCC_00220 [Ramularia collo-cygni]|uniref:Uncharacterized protein n=1 Tax=Ramularia collo-cygni TaxID=112498 RepID=A0A2D3UNU8_9PEZI|nr:uncharacterized protein RCC_00220 [Ramularia collo-cygni]CZT14245.1 uncharacterized protein RCC_00220 [Ramularia collo-cygni]
MFRILRKLLMPKPKTAAILGTIFLVYVGTKPAIEYSHARRETSIAERRVAIEEKRLELEQQRLAEERRRA